MRVVFFGSGVFAVPTLEALHNSSHTVCAVVTQPDKPVGRGQHVAPTPVAMAALTAGIPVLQPKTLKAPAAHEAILAYRPDVIVVAAYGKLIPASLLNLPPYRCVNLHPSLLPKYRGASPIQTPILNGDTATGITTMYISEALDAGDILLQIAVPIQPHETAGEVSVRLAPLGAALVVDTLDGLHDGSITPRPQNVQEATVTRLLVKADGIIQWSRPAQQIVNQIRALQPWPSAYTHWEGKPLKIFRAEIPDERVLPPGSRPGDVVAITRSIHVATGDGRLCLTEVQLAGKKRMLSETFLRGNPMPPGAHLS